MAKLTVLLEDDLMHRFKLQALADRRSVSDVVRRFAEDYAGGVLAAGAEGGVVAENLAGGGRAQKPLASHSRTPAEQSAPAASTCRRKHLHHINHGGNPCKECGWPT